MPIHHYRKWQLVCYTCDLRQEKWGFDTEMPFPCLRCGEPTTIYIEPRNQAPGLITDNFVGGYEVKHGAGLINPDGSPKKYYSKTELRRACNEAGWTQSGDTPAPYKIPWSGKRKTDAGIPIKAEES